MFTKGMLKSKYQVDAGALALVRLLKRVTEHDSGSTRPIRAVLEGIYNGNRFPVDLELVCKRLEAADFEDVLSVLRFAFKVFERDGIEMHAAFSDERAMPKALFG